MTDRDLLMIPGPIELEPAVLRALGEKTTSHVDARFIAAFGRALSALRQVAQADGAQPFIIAGSGTLAMEMAVQNLVEPGEAAVVVNTGYFSDRIGAMLERAGAHVTHVGASPGDAPAEADVEAALVKTRPKVLTITHVDTSTGVRAPLERLAALGKKHGALVVVDAVCSLGAEEIRATAWGLDVVFAGSQKALGAPPGLAVLTASPAAQAAHAARTRPVASMYADFAEWLPIMRAYEAGTPSYFATPAVNLVRALDVSLASLLEEGMSARVARHARTAAAFRAGATALGLTGLPARPELAAHTLSALRYPAGVDGALVGRVRERGVTVAGGLHPALKATYFRVGHMGAVSPSDIVAAVAAVGRALAASGHACDPGAAVAAATRALDA